jgi:hypothetical protein
VGDAISEATSVTARLRPLIAVIAGWLVLASACSAWVFLSREDPARYVATLDALPVPSTWEVVRTDAQRDLLFPPRADRYYFVDADPEDAVTVLKDALKVAGFEIYTHAASADWCDPHPLDSIAVPCPTKVIEDCRANGPGGPISCYVEAFRRIDADPRHLEDLFASLSPRGSTIDYGPGASPRYVSDPNRAVLVVSASLSDPRHFWSSPTPPPAGDRPSP